MIFVAIIFACLMGSFFFSGMEVGVLLLSRGRVRHLKEKGSWGARFLLYFLHDPSLLSSTVLVGNTLLNTVATVLIAQIFLKLGGLFAAIVAVIVFAIFLWLFGELLPKNFFRKYPNRLSVGLAPFLLLAYVTLWPIVQLFNLLSQFINLLLGGKASSRQMFAIRDELKLMANEGEHGVEMTGEQRNLIAFILNSSNFTVRDVMKSVSEVVTVSEKQSEKERLALALKTSYSRFPIQNNGQGSWENMWVAYDALFQTRQYPRTPPVVGMNVSLEEALSAFRNAKSQFGFVKDRSGKIAGIITVEDILRKYLGKIDL